MRNGRPQPDKTPIRIVLPTLEQRQRRLRADAATRAVEMAVTGGPSISTLRLWYQQAVEQHRPRAVIDKIVDRIVQAEDALYGA